ncbi:MAG TPA: nitroreductase family protein [Polyangiaceae bacterium]|nr:nitroreductase family protein [Polyangiaceae bacterium]
MDTSIASFFLGSQSEASGQRRAGSGVDAPIDESFLKRRSSREYSAQALPFEVVRTLFEAARFAPSAGNVQPWLFVYAADPLMRGRALSLLDMETRGWAGEAALLIFVFARRTHPETGAPLRTGAFDTGAAWFSLALQAQTLGLNCRATGNVDHERAHRMLGVPTSSYESMIAVAIGYPAPPSGAQSAAERRNTRKLQHLFVFNGRYVGESDVQGLRSTQTPSGSDSR